MGNKKSNTPKGQTKIKLGMELPKRPAKTIKVNTTQSKKTK